MLIGVRQRQKGQKHLLAEPHAFEHAMGAVTIGEDVAMRRHDALWRTAGSRSVEETGDIVGRQGGDALADILLRRSAAREQLLP